MENYIYISHLTDAFIKKRLKNEDNGSNQNKWYASAMTSLS